MNNFGCKVILVDLKTLTELDSVILQDLLSIEEVAIGLKFVTMGQLVVLSKHKETQAISKCMIAQEVSGLGFTMIEPLEIMGQVDLGFNGQDQTEIGGTSPSTPL